MSNQIYGAISASELSFKQQPQMANTCGLPELPDPQEIYVAIHGVRPRNASTLGGSSRCSRSNSSCDTNSLARRERRYSANQHQSQTLTRSTGARYATVRSSARYSVAPQVPAQPKPPSLAARDSGSLRMSFRSSLDVADGDCRSQTKSAELGERTYDTYGSRNGLESSLHNQSQMSNDSFMSAKSHFQDSITSSQDKMKSVSRMSLSSSTTKVFQNQISSIRKFFRNMPLRKSFTGSSSHSRSNGFDALDSRSVGGPTLSEDQILQDSISQILQNRSQSPPVCPPPPGELKSMSYMESNNITYSNYDEFTKARNERCKTLLSSNRSGRHMIGADTQRPQSADSMDSGDAWQLTSLPVSYERNLATVFEERQISGDLARLSVMKRANGDEPREQIYGITNHHLHQLASDHARDSIRVPENFEITQHKSSTTTNSSTQSLTSSTNTNDSVLDNHRQTSQVAPAKPFRFSFAQPPSPVESVSHVSSVDACIRSASTRESRRKTVAITNLDLDLAKRAPNSTPVDTCDSSSLTNQNNLSPVYGRLQGSDTQQQLANNTTNNSGLPPRMPTTIAGIYDSKQDTSSGASSSNSSVMSGANNCDPRPTTTSSFKLDSSSDYGVISGVADNDADTTIMSDTSTLQGDYNTLTYMNKCSELERTVERLKEIIMILEKEKTELRLEQINSDYLIEQLKKGNSRLEKENVQLKSMLINNGRVNL